MNGVLSAELAILVHFKSVRIIFLVFHCVVIALLAFSTSQCDFNSHNGTSRFTEIFFCCIIAVNASLGSGKHNSPTVLCRHTEGKHTEVFDLDRTESKQKKRLFRGAPIITQKLLSVKTFFH